MTYAELLGHAGRHPGAFEEFYRRHAGKVVAFAVRRCSKPDASTPHKKGKGSPPWLR
jgi:hypothetical protein